MRKASTRATGISVPVTATAGQITVQIADLPVPSRRFLANAVDVVKDADGGVQVLLGQRRAVGSGLRMLLVARTSLLHARDFLATTEQFAVNVAEFLDRAGLAPATPYTFHEEPSEAVEVQFAIIAVVFAGADASLDLYYFSPWAIHEYRQAGGASKETTVDPIVRVQLPTQSLAMLLTRLKETVNGTAP